MLELLSQDQTDLELDIEEELQGDPNVSHAIPFCYKHHGAEWFPASGTIVETICGKLIRVRQYLVAPESKAKCTKCSSFHGKSFSCFVCGRKIIG